MGAHTCIHPFLLLTCSLDFEASFTDNTPPHLPLRSCFLHRIPCNTFSPCHRYKKNTTGDLGNQNKWPDIQINGWTREFVILWALLALSYFCTVSWLSSSEQSPCNTCISSASIIHPVKIDCATANRATRVSCCHEPQQGHRTRWGCCSCSGIQRGRADVLLQGKHQGFNLKVPFSPPHLCFWHPAPE